MLTKDNFIHSAHRYTNRYKENLDCLMCMHSLPVDGGHFQTKVLQKNWFCTIQGGKTSHVLDMGSLTKIFTFGVSLHVHLTILSYNAAVSGCEGPNKNYQTWFSDRNFAICKCTMLVGLHHTGITLGMYFYAHQLLFAPCSCFRIITTFNHSHSIVKWCQNW